MVINFANTDMVGHTGDLKATIASAEAIDDCLQILVKKISELGGLSLITLTMAMPK